MWEAKGFGSTRTLASFTYLKMRQTELWGIPPIAFSGRGSTPQTAFRGRPRRYTRIPRRCKERTGGYGSLRQEALPGSTRRRRLRERSFRLLSRLKLSPAMAGLMMLRTDCDCRRIYAILRLTTRL